jgi:hypothetical protein
MVTCTLAPCYAGGRLIANVGVLASDAPVTP